MAKEIYSVFTGTGKCIPPKMVPNSYFKDHRFYDSKGNRYVKENGEVQDGEESADKVSQISAIEVRRYAKEDQNTSDLAYEAAKNCLESSDTDPETLDGITVAQNFGDISYDNRRSDIVPSLAARVKHYLKIKNPKTICYDLQFGCPGWLQGVIQANQRIKSGDAKKILVIGAETLERVCDPHDRDITLYSAGAGAGLLEARLSEKPVGILSYSARSDTFKEAFMLRMETSYGPDHNGDELYLHMDGRDLFKYAAKTVPLVVQEALEKAEITDIKDVKKILIHQANARLDEAIVKNLFKKYGIRLDEVPEKIMPMTISWLGNSSVATLPTLLDLIRKKELAGHELKPHDLVVFASVGAGMNINAVPYRFPKN